MTPIERTEAAVTGPRDERVFSTPSEKGILWPE